MGPEHSAGVGTLTNRDTVELTAFRHHPHRHPEVSGQEARTAAQVAAGLEPLHPARLLTGLGGTAAAPSGRAPPPARP